jgi:hypothetical protein
MMMILMIIITQNVLVVFVVLSVFLWFSLHPALADPLSNSLRQRIGDYDIQINTLPIVPISGKETIINIRVNTVSNIPVTDTPIVIRISDENNELIRTQPILLSSGHYSYDYNFNKSGIFLLSIDILDNPVLGDSFDSNKKLIFDFPIRVSEPYSAEIVKMTLPITITVFAIGSVISLVLLRKFKKSKKVN